MIELLKSYSVALASFLIIDLMYLTFVAKSFYLKHLAAIGRIDDGSLKVVMWAAVGVYVVMSAGLVYFVLPRVRFESNWLMVFLVGAIFGFVTYGVYDLTNLATLKDWDLPLTLGDMAWGTVLCGLVTVIVKFIRF